MFCIEKICRPCKGKEKEMKSPYKTQVISYLLLIKIKQLFYNEPEKNYKNDCQKKLTFPIVFLNVKMLLKKCKSCTLISHISVVDTVIYIWLVAVFC